MVSYILDVLLNSDSRLLCTEYLLTCVRLLGLVQDPPLTWVQKYLLDRLLQYRIDLEQCHIRALPVIDALGESFSKVPTGENRELQNAFRYPTYFEQIFMASHFEYKE